MTDRLRRLDALFAERVLGYTTERGLVWTSGEDGWRLTGRPGEGDILMPYPRPLPRYTRSLDAAWEGMKIAGLRISVFEANHEGFAEVCVTHVDTAKQPYNGWFEGYPDVAHPAEALVLACLRAVGVGGEELDG